MDYDIKDRIDSETMAEYEDIDLKRTTNGLAVEIHFPSDTSQEKAIAWLEDALSKVDSASFLRVSADLWITPKVEDNG
jgi:hypothetical protein